MTEIEKAYAFLGLLRRGGRLLFEGASKESLGQAVGFEVISAVLIADRKATKSFNQKWNAAKGVQDEEK